MRKVEQDANGGVIAVMQVINKRPYRAFLSHAHVDNAVADRLYRWCTDIADIRVWYDAAELPPARQVAAALGEAITDCQSAIILVSNDSIKSGWVRQELNICIGQQVKFPDFQVIPICMDVSSVPPELESYKWIDLPRGEMSPTVATQLVEALHWNDSDPRTIFRRQVYMARGSRPREAQTASEIARKLAEFGLRTVRDAPDHPHFDDLRVKTIIQSCGALIAVVPHRGEGKTSPYILREMKLGEDLGIPILAIVEDGVQEAFAASDRLRVQRTPPFDGGLLPSLEDVIAEFAENVGEPVRPAHCFFGHSFAGEQAEAWSCVQRCIQAVSGIPCISGDQIPGGDVQTQIIARIRDATLGIFDITEDRLNSCIEAGIALGAQTPLELVCRGPRRRPPFVFRDRQIWFYETPTELVGLARKLALPYRRVVN